jgi:hypothetical protein
LLRTATPEPDEPTRPHAQIEPLRGDSGHVVVTIAVSTTEDLDVLGEAIGEALADLWLAGQLDLD